MLAAVDDVVPFSFAIDGDDVTMTGSNPATGHPTVHVEPDRPPARTWLERVCEQCRQETTSVAGRERGRRSAR